MERPEGAEMQRVNGEEQQAEGKSPTYAGDRPQTAKWQVRQRAARHACTDRWSAMEGTPPGGVKGGSHCRGMICWQGTLMTTLSLSPVI